MKKFFLCLSLIISGTFLNAQSRLGIDTNSLTYSIPTTTYYGNLDHYRVTLKNYGNMTFIGWYEVVYAVDSSANNGILQQIIVDSIASATINVGSTRPDSVNIPIDSVRFRKGINTVVIWPRSNATITYDSLKINVLVLGYSGIENYTLGRLVLFPNPAQSILYVANNNPSFIIEQVRILDIMGQPVFAGQFTGKLDLRNLSSGAYTLEFADKNGRTSRYKVIKE